MATSSSSAPSRAAETGTPADSAAEQRRESEAPGDRVPVIDRDIDHGIDIHLDANGDPRMVERRFVVEDVYVGYRLDHYLKRKIPRLSRTRLQRIIRTQVLPVRGRRLKPHSPVAEGDEIIIRRPAKPEPACPRTFEVLHDDGQMMVIDKPAGLPMHASAKFYFNTLTRVLLERYPDDPLQICHRIDRETSGAVVVARGKVAAAALKGAFARHRVRKAYLAVVHGQPPWPGLPDGDGDGERDGDLDAIIAEALRRALQQADEPGRGARRDEQRDHQPGHLPGHLIDLPLGLTKDPDALISIRMVVRDDAPPARTRVTVLATRPRCALVLCMPISGRQHQIRAHLAACGHPIVGDKLYAHGDQAFADYCDHGMTPELLARFQLPRQALHAAAIAIAHPVTREPVEVISPLPGDLRAHLDAAPESSPTGESTSPSPGTSGRDPTTLHSSE